MLLFHLLLPVLVHAEPALAVEPKKYTTVISEDSYKHDVISTQRALQTETDCTDYPPDWAADYNDSDYDCDYFISLLEYDDDYNYVCINSNLAQSIDQDNGLKVKDACCACGGGQREEESASPSEIPSAPPSEIPSAPPSEIPSAPPSEIPSAPPSEMPSASYNYEPSFNPSKKASEMPSASYNEEPEQDWFIRYIGSLLSNNALTSTYNTKAGYGTVGTDYITSFTDGACASGGISHDEISHDESVFTFTTATNDADNTLVITKTINAAAIANQHDGSFTFCEKVALTDAGVSQTYEVVYAKTQYTITATFLAEMNMFFATLQDDTSINMESPDLSLSGTVVVTRCNGVSENLNPGDELCLEISETSSTDIGVESINNLNLNQDVATFAAIKDGVNQHTNLVVPDCTNVPGTCTVYITVPSFMYEDSSGSDTVTMGVSGDVYLYDMNPSSPKNGKAETNSFSFSVTLEKPCEGGLLGSIAKMFSK